MHFQLGLIHHMLGLYAELQLNFREALQLGSEFENLACSSLFVNLLYGIFHVLTQREHVEDSVALFQAALWLYNKFQRLGLVLEGRKGVAGLLPAASAA